MNVGLINHVKISCFYPSDRSHSLWALPILGGPQFFPQLSGIMHLFQQPLTAASLVIHIIAINLFLGRTVALDGEPDQITWKIRVYTQHPA